MVKVAVIIPVYNGGLKIVNALKSLENQTFKDWRAIIINDGSTDDTLKYIYKYNSKKIEIINLQKNHGRGYARQVGIERVVELNIPYMAMLDADDWYYTNKLAFQFNFMENNPEITLLSNAMAIVNEKNELYKVVQPYSRITTFYFNTYPRFVQLPHASSMIKMSHLNEAFYKTDFKFSEDLDFLRRILLNKKYCFSPEILYSYHRDASFSVSKYSKATAFNIKSFNQLDVSIFSKFKYWISSTIKIYTVFILSIFGLQNIYRNRIGIIPTNDDFENFNKVKSTLT